jgi:hypothetical protein
MWWISRAIVVFGMNMVYQGSPLSHHDYFWPGIVLGAVVIAAGTGLIRKGEQTIQKTRDLGAQEIFKNPEGKRFSLYLRPFETSGTFVIGTTTGKIFDFAEYDRPGAEALERLFADAFRRTAPLVGLGGHGDIEFGPGTAGFIPNWKEEIVKAMVATTYIIVVPSANLGTLWEIGEIRARNFYFKSIFIMPPDAKFRNMPGVPDYAEPWQAARTSCMREFGMLLPPYEAKGAIFQMKSDQELASINRCKFSTPSDVVKSVNRLVKM